MIWERTDVVEFPTTDGDTETERGEGRVLESSHRQILDLPTPSSEFLPPPSPRSDRPITAILKNRKRGIHSEGDLYQPPASPHEQHPCK